ncbi:hypothetical protein KZH69_15085 [Flavobacterium sp. NAS39]|uniref:Uncharacterized protein n=2 Tax=Flavobacterium taihuense TaxID=2857508 RepID=A0ABS6XZU9_9FLAO|nr:hypothetical protein [Flavobacterium taihuense]
MQNKFFITIVLMVFVSWTNLVNAQQTEMSSIKIGKSRSNIQNNKGLPINVTQTYCTVIVKCMNGSCTIDYVNSKSATEVNSSKALEKRMHNSFVIVKEPNAVAQTKNDLINYQDVTTNISKEKNQVQLISDVTAKVSCEGRATTLIKLFSINSEYIVPIECKKGKCDVELYWSWGAPNSGSIKTYAGGRFILEMDNGICTDMTINKKDISGAKN